MSYEWPLGKDARSQCGALASSGLTEGAGACPASAPSVSQPLLPLALEDHVVLVKASAAFDAIARKRAVQILDHGHTPAEDLERDLAHLVLEAKARLHAFLDLVPRGRMNLATRSAIARSAISRSAAR
jgi:hypothetical protein